MTPQYMLIETRVMVLRRILWKLPKDSYDYTQLRNRVLGNIQAMRFLKSEYRRRSITSTSIAA